MKKMLYSLLVAGALSTVVCSTTLAGVAATQSSLDNPTTNDRKTVVLKHSSHHKNSLVKKMNHAMRVMLGLAPSKAVVSPAKRSRQLHAHQRQMRAQNRFSSRQRWSLCH